MDGVRGADIEHMKNPLHSVPAGRYLAIAALAVGAVPFAAGN
jgi:hypothetical protein